MSAPLNIKTCAFCGDTKSLSEFYFCRGPYNPDGFYTKGCKECHKARARANRAARLEYYQEYDRGRGRRNSKKKETKAERLLRIALWEKRYPEKREAHRVFHLAKKKNLIVPQSCEHCGSPPPTHGHHPDYSKPLEVVWLCKTCHGLEHRRLNELQRQQNKKAVLEQP